MAGQIEDSAQGFSPRLDKSNKQAEFSILNFSVVIFVVSARRKMLGHGVIKDRISSQIQASAQGFSSRLGESAMPH
jgi:hypothetical protein